MDYAVVQSPATEADTVELVLEGALATWRAEHDRRRLRRELVRVLGKLDD